MWLGDVRLKAALSTSGRDRRGTGRTCCCLASAAMAWHRPPVGGGAIGAWNLVCRAYDLSADPEAQKYNLWGDRCRRAPQLAGTRAGQFVRAIAPLGYQPVPFGPISGTSGSNLTLESRMGFPSDLPNVVVGFQAAISCFVAEANDDPKPFTWLADPNKSIVAVRRGYQVLDSIHYSKLRSSEDWRG